MHKCDKCVHADVCCILFTENCEYFKDRSRIVELPCKVGDTVWHFFKLRGKYSLKQYSVEEISIDQFAVYVKLETLIGNGASLVDGEAFGKCVFFTREEAEAALAKMKV